MRRIFLWQLHFCTYEGGIYGSTDKEGRFVVRCSLDSFGLGFEICLSYWR